MIYLNDLGRVELAIRRAISEIPSRDFTAITLAQTLLSFADQLRDLQQVAVTESDLEEARRAE